MEINTTSFVKVIGTNQIGMVVEKNKNNIMVAFEDESSIMPEYCKFKSYQLEVVELPKLKTSQLKSFVRGEITVEELTNGVNFFPKELEEDSKTYQVTASDLLEGIQNYLGKSAEDIYRWLINLQFFSQKIFPSEGLLEEIKDAVTEEIILILARYEIENISNWIFANELTDVPAEYFKEFKEILELWIKSEGKDYPEVIKYLISKQYDCHNIDNQSKETQELFKKCLDYCCDVKKDPQSIQRRGYCYYCGTQIYPNDWMKAKDAFIEYYNLTGDVSAANTLGYIYYYGRCNNGIPEYDLAFKYFSIGHAGGSFESSYKMADMFAHGYGVAKNENLASQLYYEVYKKTEKQFAFGIFENEFADAALRMGNCFKNEIGVQKDLEIAYGYYLQADYAIKERMKVVNFYGDEKVYKGIQKSLAEVRETYKEKGNTVKFQYPRWVEWACMGNGCCKLSIKETKDKRLVIDVTPFARNQETPMMLITITKADYCELKNKIRIKTAPESQYKIKKGKEEFVFDDVEYDIAIGKTTFYLRDEIVGEIITDYYAFTAPKKTKKDSSN